MPAVSLPEDECCRILILAIQGKDREAFETFIGRFVSTVRGKLRSILGNHPEVEDLEQEVWTSAWANRHSLDPDASGCVGIRAWLRMIARNKAIDWLQHVHPIPLPPDADPPVSPVFPREPYRLIEFLRLIVQTGQDDICGLLVFLGLYWLHRKPQEILALGDMPLRDILQKTINELYDAVSEKGIQVSQRQWDTIFAPLVKRMEQLHTDGKPIRHHTFLEYCQPKDAGQIADWAHGFLQRILTAVRKAAREFLALVCASRPHHAIVYLWNVSRKDPIETAKALSDLATEIKKTLKRTPLNGHDVEQGLAELDAKLNGYVLAHLHAVPRWLDCLRRGIQQMGDTRIDDYPPVKLQAWEASTRLDVKDRLKHQRYSPTYLPFCEGLLRARV